MTKDILQRDNRWQAFYDNITLEEFIQKLPEIRLYEIVHEDVKEAFKIIHKLMIHSYYEYLFIDVGVTKALHCFEMALKIRYKELTAEEWSKRGRNLEQLLEWFRKKGHFEFDQESYIGQVRKIRNHLTHPERHNTGGTVWFHWISTTIDLINDVYDDVTLRKQRKELDVEIGQKLKTFLQDGARFQYKSESLIYSSGHVRVNNFIQPNEIQFSLLEIFDDSTRVKWPLVITCDVSALKLDSTTITLVDHGGIQLTITNELNEKEKKIVEAFKKQLSTDVNKIMQHNSLLFDSQKALLDAWRQDRHNRT